MKTIEEFAKKSAKETINKLYDKNGSNTNRHINGFKKGVEFAQRWIPIEEEIPTKQGCYLVKCKTSYPKNCEVVIAEFYEDNNTFYSESSDYPIHDATHWRQIEYL